MPLDRNPSSMSSDELLRVARALRKEHTPGSFHRVVVELGRRGTRVDFDTLGQGEETTDSAPRVVVGWLRRQLALILRLLAFFAVEIVAVILGGALLAWLL